MSNKPLKLELEKVLQGNANEIVAARGAAKIIHSTNDIDAAGDEVEQTVRKVLSQKLSQTYYVGHGHIVDSSWETSPQLDVIIVDNAGAPILFETKNGTQYFPYESVYAIGEVKTTYYKSKKYIHEFTDTLARIKSTLQREKILRTKGGQLTSFKKELPESTYGSSNPLFTFMLFADAGDFAIDDIKELYGEKHYRDLPNVLCLLNRGVVLFKIEGAWENGDNWGFYSIHPGLVEEVNLIAQSRQSGNWYFNQFGNEENQNGANFGFLVAILSTFLARCTLEQPNMYNYLERVFELRASSRIS